MYRLPTQFEPRASHADESASAGGSTSTTCSCCVVSLGAGSVLTSVYFASLTQPAQAESPTPPGPVPESGVGGESPASADAASASPPATRGSPGNWAMLGFFTPLLSLGVGAVLGFGLGGLAMAPVIAVGMWLLLFGMAHERNGQSMGRGVAAGALGLVLFAVALAVEISFWLK